MKFISVDIDFLDIYSKNFHLKMAEIFGFPDFYGKNLAALIDCLSDLRTFWGRRAHDSLLFKR